MQAIVLLPLLLTLAVGLKYGFREAFVYVCLPLFLLLPDYYRFKLPGIPEFTPWNYTFLAVFGALLLSEDRRHLRPHPLDLLPILFVYFCVRSEYDIKGWKDTQNLLANMTFGCILPYYLGKVMVRVPGLLTGALTMIGLVCACVGFVSIYEARMGTNPFDVWRNFWPVSVPFDGALYRSGIRRVQGPFSHPIFGGFIYSMVIPCLFWLRDRNALRGWKARWLLVAGCVVGLLTTVSRGPMLGCLLTCGVMSLGWMRLRSVAVGVALLGALVLPVLVGVQVQKFLSLDRATARTESEETAAYRKEMMENYWEVVMAEPIHGYGKNQVPVVKGQKSIDNMYLFTALQYGCPAALTYVLLMGLPAALLFVRLLAVRSTHAYGRLGWVFVGMMGGSMFTQFTVVAGGQSLPLFFLLIGSSIGLSARLGREHHGASRPRRRAHLTPALAPA